MGATGLRQEEQGDHCEVVVREAARAAVWAPLEDLAQVEEMASWAVALASFSGMVV